MAGGRTRTSGQGRPKGSKNKATKALKEMILAALDAAGGIDYLVERANDTPTAFLALIGKVLPLQVTGADGGPIQVITSVPRADD
jgi:hypothetical protein